jgi:tetratricopeptide (TPR) repeat protein
MSKKYFIAILFISLLSSFVFVQEGHALPQISDETPFEFKLKIVEKKSKRQIKSASVYVNGIEFPYNFIREHYPIRAKKGDQLVVYDASFETIFYTIETNEDIKIEIESPDSRSNNSLRTGYYFKDNSIGSQYFVNLDSANYYKTLDIDKSLSFIENILKKNYSKRRNAATYRLLGDIYYEWKQFDLAISSFKNSLQYDNKDETTKLELAKAAFILKDYNEAETYLLDINTKQLGLFQKILVYEVLGDIYLRQKNYEDATTYYKKALKIAEENKITSKVIDLNSELGDVLVAQGKIEKANRQFQNTIELAEREDPVRSLEEKNKVADYFNKTQQFDKEINLRKEALLETKKLNDSVLLVTDSKRAKPSPQSKTKQKETDTETEGNFFDGLSSISSISENNYKIGRALVQKEDYEGAIPFLEKSIKNANEGKDLVVKKDATRKLSEVYSSVGEYDKAFTTYREYVDLVDTLYVRKEQEIEQAKRFAKKISENQNRIASLEKDRELTESKVTLAVKDQELSQARNRSQQYVIYSLIGGILIMLVFATLLFRSNKQQKLANNLLALKSMRSQMNPHFIFNALNSVNSFIAVNDERNANRYLSEFSVLMRSVLENSDEDFIPFAKEIELLELYVKLEHNRFQEKFDYEISVDKSIDLDQFAIPPMLLQPYIENAIWHGLRYKEEKGILEIKIAQQDDETLAVTIADNGVGRKRSQQLKTKNQLKRKSKGMSTIKNRIRILNDMYQDRISVSVSDLFEDGSGTKVELLLKRNKTS